MRCIRHVPEPLKAQIRRVRRLATRREPPVSVVAAWSEQFLSVTTSFASGTAIVLLPDAGWWPMDRRHPRLGVRPGKASRCRGTHSATRRAVDSTSSWCRSRRWASVSSEELFDVIGRRLSGGGAVAAVVPGPAWRPGDGAPGATRRGPGRPATTRGSSASRGCRSLSRRSATTSRPTRRGGRPRLGRCPRRRDRSPRS